LSESTHAVRPLSTPLLDALLDAGVAAGAIAVAAVEDQALVQDDGLEQAVGADVLDELPELGALDLQQREEGGGRVEVEVAGSCASKMAVSSRPASTRSAAQVSLP